MPNIMKMPEQWAVNFGYAATKQTAQALGEEVIALKMYHVNNDAGTQPRCSHCYDDVYAQTDSYGCEFCYGTTFEDGVKEVWRIWALITDQDQQDEKMEKGGVWQNETHRAQMEPHPPLEQHDYIRRVKKWDNNRQIPLELGSYYKLGAVTPISIRTGARYGQTVSDAIAQTAQIFYLPTTEVIYKYDILTEVTFPRFDGQPR